MNQAETSTDFEINIQKPGEEGAFSKDAVVDFLYHHLDEFGDKREDIMACINYALSTAEGKGGLVATASEGDEILGAVIINDTGMSGYIPENILVYIAVHAKTRGRGVGKKLMQTAINNVEGAVALHVEPQNPACKLYEKLGFTNKYLEMRLAR